MSEKKQDSANLPTLAILGGTGKEGRGLAMRWASVGFPVVIGSRFAEKARATAMELNKKLGIESIRGMKNDEAARVADICVLTVVHSAHQEAVDSLKGILDGKILVDATARVDYADPKPPPPPAAARYAQDVLGERVRVVAAFQSVPAHSLKKNLGKPIDANVLVCSDDVQAADQVIRLAEAGGMRAFYCGPLDMGLVVEGLTALLISMNKHYGVSTASISIVGLPDKGDEPSESPS